MSITIRQYRLEDADPIAALYNRFPDNPNPVAGGITGAQLHAELADRDTAAMFVATDGDGEIVGTFGLFRTNGRRSVRPGELIADMFFVAPNHRNGLMTGRLFTEAIEWMVESAGCLVIRLTVNPANTTAFKLYRRVGCVAVGRSVPGEDGNVELHNYIPLILRSVLHGLGSDARAAIGAMTSFGAVTQTRGEELLSDVRIVDGARTVAYDLVAGDFRIDVIVDVDRGALAAAQITGPDGVRRPLRPMALPYTVHARPAEESHSIVDGALTATVDGVDGTLEVFAEGHLGPVLRSTWPSCAPGRHAGWREAQPCELDIVEFEGGLQIVERAGADETVGTVYLSDGQLQQEFRSTRPLPRVFHSVGLRQGTLTQTDRDGTSWSAPIGLGTGVRDSSEVVAAGHAVTTGSHLRWEGAGATVSTTVEGAAALVHDALLDLRAAPGAAILTLRTVITTHAAATGVAPGPTGSAAAKRNVRVLAKARGVTAWREDGVRVLRSPYPRSTAFACNPTWSAGMWVTTEQSRHDRSGLGWGLTSAAWDEKHPLGLASPELQTGWELAVPDDPADPVLATVVGPDDIAEDDAEVVLWLTPDARPGAGVRIHPTGNGAPHVVTGFRQVWAGAVTVELTGDRLLHCRPAPGAPSDAEIVVRSSAAGLLVGCVSASGSTPGAWLFSVSPGSLTELSDDPERR